MQKNHKKKVWIGIAVGAVCCTLILGGLFVFFAMKFLRGEETVVTDIARYEEALKGYSGNIDFHTGLITFPESIPDSATDIDFYCLEHVFLVGSTGEFFLQCTYDEQDYQAEIERLEHTYKQYGSMKKQLFYDEERFAYPAYIAIDGNLGDYEYALLTGERQITYISTSFLGEESEKIKKEYMPFEPENFTDETHEELGENYSIYLVKKYEYADGTVGREYDYTRDSWVAVEEHHYEKIGDNLFYVNTYLDETDTEIIQDCSFRYYESKYDRVYGLPDDIAYEDLQGYRFKSLELSEDKTIAYVTYYDGEEEKVRKYKIPDIQGEK